MSGPVLLVLRLALAISLYAFLGWAFLILWRDLRVQSALLAARKTPPIMLGIQSEGSQTQARHFTQAEILIGRDPACDCPLDDETISARHARLAYHHGQWWLEDLSSTNGTKLNGSPLAMPTVVISGDKVACGQTVFIVSLGNDTVVPPTLQL